MRLSLFQELLADDYYLSLHQQAGTGLIPSFLSKRRDRGAPPSVRPSLFQELLTEDDYRSLHQRLAPV